MDPTPADEVAPMLLEAGEPSLPRRSRFAVPFGVFVLVGIGAVFAYVVGSPIQVHRVGFEGVVEFFRINVKTVKGDEYTIEVEGMDTIDNLKSKLSDKTGVGREGLSLYLGGKDDELQGDSTLNDAGIDSSSNIHMGIRVDCPRPRPAENLKRLALGRLRKERGLVHQQCGDFVSESEERGDNPWTAWHLNLKGPAGSPYEGGIFPFTMSFPEGYPFKPPSLRFDTPIYNMNVASDGFVCVPVLDRERYRPSMNLCQILRSLHAILEDPIRDPDNTLRPELARLFNENKAEYLEKAKASVGS